MGLLLRWSGSAVAGLALAAAALAPPAEGQTPDADAIKRGEYIFNAAGCLGCHTDEKNKGPRLAGGRALRTPFGTFHGPNITPDPTHGIGAWTEAQFLRALREGRGADGSHLFPAFPYTSFTGMTDADAKDLWAYLRAQPAVAQPNKPHDLGFPYNIRALMMAWNWLFFSPGEFRPDASPTPELKRGAYLVNALGHCGECHTPRNFFGATRGDMKMAGAVLGDGAVPNLTPDPDTGIGKWSPDDLVELLKSGMTPEGDFVGSEMGEVVANTTGKLTDADRRAIVAYLRSLPPIRHHVRKPAAK
ncbi:MAG: c-type cytochrome [Alphaproteobacteria bacterium]|nr:c-type cytochrome [Alphaproteobacteria bacterium]